jgi:hypothetical protein
VSNLIKLLLSGFDAPAIAAADIDYSTFEHALLPLKTLNDPPQ